MTALFMNAPGSPSSALQIRYFSLPFALRAAFHLNHVGNPAPPRPARPDFFISSITPSEEIASVAFCAESPRPRILDIAPYPPAARYSSMDSGSITPQFLSAMRVCFERNSPSSADIIMSDKLEKSPDSEALKMRSASLSLTRTSLAATAPESSRISTIGSR